MIISLFLNIAAGDTPSMTSSGGRRGSVMPPLIHRVPTPSNAGETESLAALRDKYQAGKEQYSTRERSPDVVDSLRQEHAFSGNPFNDEEDHAAAAATATDQQHVVPDDKRTQEGKQAGNSSEEEASSCWQRFCCLCCGCC